MAWLAGVAVWEEHAARDAVDAAAGGARVLRAVMVVVSLELKTFVWLALAPIKEGFRAQFHVLLDDLRWQNDRVRAEDVCIVETHADLLPDTLELREIASERGYNFVNASREPLVDPDLMEEALEKLLQPHAMTRWKRARALLEPQGFHHCVETLYTVVHSAETVLENPRLENTFQFTIQVHTEPVRDYMRLNKAARRIINEPLRSLFKPFCHTKRGRQCLLARLERPELDAAVLDHWHELLKEVLRSEDECKNAVVELLESAAAAESHLLLKFETAPTLEDFRVLCGRSRQIQAACQALYEACDATTTPQLHATLVSRLTSIVDKVLMPFIEATEIKLRLFEGEDSHDRHSAQAASPSVQSLRGQVSLSERSIQTHRDEMATILLLQPERMKVVYEDDDLSSSATKAATVLFRVTRQDAHRVFKAKSVASHRSAKKPKLADNASVPDTAVTLVYSRRTTGVWFSTPRLDTLAVQWRALHLEIHRVETQLLTSLMELYNCSVRAQLQEWTTCIAQLDVVTAFAQLSHQHGFTRAVSVGSDHKIECVDLRWPWETSSGSTTMSQSIHQDGDHPLLVVHSAIGEDGSLSTRVALAVVLHQIGCFVPCLHASLSVVDALFVRAGAQDQTLANESTFLSEMQEMSTILTRATPQSVVLIDELCRGTSPAEGLPLAIEICRFLVDKRVFTCVSTQWTELLDALIRLDHSTVPTTPNRPTEDPKHVYTARLLGCDQRFLSSLYDQDFPTELIELIENDLPAHQDHTPR